MAHPFFISNNFVCVGFQGEGDIFALYCGDICSTVCCLMCKNVEEMYCNRYLCIPPPPSSFFFSPPPFLLIHFYLFFYLCLTVILSFFLCLSICLYVNIFSFLFKIWMSTADCWHLKRAYSSSILSLPPLNLDF